VAAGYQWLLVNVTSPAEVRSHDGSLPRRNGLGIASLVLGIAACAGAVFPLVNYVSGFVAAVGLVLGIVALARQGRARSAALAGTILGIAGILLSVSLVMTYTFRSMYIGDVVDARVSGVVLPPTATGGVKDQATDGTREHPYPLRTTVSFTADGVPFYDITVSGSTLDADAEVALDNPDFQEPEAGTQYALLALAITYTGTDLGNPSWDLVATFETPDGAFHSEGDIQAYGTDDIYELYDVLPGELVTGKFAVTIPSDEVRDGLWVLEVGDSTEGNVYFAA
jgi:hypothetical protein